LPNITIAGSDLYWTVAAVVVYYLAAWSIVGRKRRHESIAIRYQPPEGLSPAAIRYLYTMRSDGRSYAAIIAQLAARKLLVVVPGKEHGAIYVERLAEDYGRLRNLPEEERLILLNGFAAPCLRNYTAAGRKALSEIEGFRQFLEGTEQDRLQRMNRVGQRAMFDAEFIPHAIALDLREGWGDDLGVKAMVETAL